MPGWTSEELTRIEKAEELRLASLRRNGTLRDPVTMWVVRADDDLYVRAMHGPTSTWYRGTQTSHRGHIWAGGVDKDVAFTDADHSLDKAIDAAYHAKYDRYGPRVVGTIVNPEARAATIKLLPRPS